MEKITVEIRSGEGGSDAKLLVKDQYNIYCRYAALERLCVSLKSSSDGFIQFEVSGNDAYEKFKNESGGLRWQRVPPTESKGRYHTSTITVAVLRCENSSDINIQEKDLDWQFCRGSGAGGQNRNKRDTAVWLKHKPSGIQIRSEGERSQNMNKVEALNKLKAKLESIKSDSRSSTINKDRKQQVGEGKRGDKIRTIRVRDNTVKSHLNERKIKYTEYVKGNFGRLIE